MAINITVFIKPAIILPALLFENIASIPAKIIKTGQKGYKLNQIVQGRMPKLLTADGLHPNNDGHKQISEIIYKFLEDKQIV